MTNKYLKQSGNFAGEMFANGEIRRAISSNEIKSEGNVKGTLTLYIFLTRRDCGKQIFSAKYRHNLRKECQEESIPIESHWPHCRAILDLVEI